MSWMMPGVLLDGSAYAFIERGGRGEISSLHPLPHRSVKPMIAPDGQVFYSVGNYDTKPDISNTTTVPARDIFPIRINCLSHPLIGQSPVVSFGLSLSTNQNIQFTNENFYSNESRPSGVLMSPHTMTESEMEILRKSWKTVSQGAGAGSTPVLPRGIEWKPISVSANDAQMIDTLKLTAYDIAKVYRVPRYMLGDMADVNFNSAEMMARDFANSALRYWFELIEQSLFRAFDLGINDVITFDYESSMIRAQFSDRMDAYARAVQGGVMTPNEVREREGLRPIDGADTLFLQAQMEPVEVRAAAQIETPDPVADEPEPEKEPDQSESEEVEDERIYQLLEREFSAESNLHAELQKYLSEQN